MNKEEKKENKKLKVVEQIGIGLGAIGLGVFLGYSMKFVKFENAVWNFDILNNTNLVVRARTKGSKKCLKWIFDEKATKEIVDHLFDELYPGD